MYPTGSTFKPIVAEAALSEGIITPSTQQLCTGSFTVGTTVFHNVEAGVYSSMSLPTALAQSCDTWFYRLGAQFYLRGSQGMQHWAKLLGLGHPTGFDVPGETPGLIPTPAWLEQTYHEPWYEGQSVNLSIGQGYLQVTPLQLAVAYSALVERRHRRAPARRAGAPPRRVGADAEVQAGAEGEADRRVGDQAGALRRGATRRTAPPPRSSRTSRSRSPARRAPRSRAQAGATTRGTRRGRRANNPKVVVVVLIAHGGFGAEAAAPAAREIYQAFFRLKGSKP